MTPRNADAVASVMSLSISCRRRRICAALYSSGKLRWKPTATRAAVSLTALWALARADLGRVRCPVLLFRSPTDHVVEPVNSDLVLEGVGSDDVTDIVLHDSHHVATLDNDAPRIFTDSVAFVRRVHAARSTASAGSTPGTTA